MALTRATPTNELYWVQVSAIGKSGFVADPATWPFPWKVKKTFPVGSNVLWTINDHDSPNMRIALNVLRSLREGWEYHARNKPAWSGYLPPVPVSYPDECAISPGRSCYYPLFHLIYIQRSDGDIDDQVLHEYAHFVWFATGFTLLPGGGLHSPCEESSPSLAFGEGWADYFAGAVKGSPYFVPAPHYLWLDLETGVTWDFEEPCSVNSDAYEGAVAAVLWDAADPRGSGLERFDQVNDETRVYQIVTGAWPFRLTTPALSDFRTAWNDADLDPIIDVYTRANPVALVTTGTVQPRVVTAGQSLVITVAGLNFGGSAAWGSLSVSFPSLSQPVQQTECGNTAGYHEPDADVTASTSADITARFFPNRSNDPGGCPIKSGQAQFLLVEGAGYWGAGETQSITITWTPKISGNFDVYVRMVLCKDVSCSAKNANQVSQDPASTDQQSNLGYHFSVTVNPHTLTFTEPPHGTPNPVDSGQAVQLNAMVTDSHPNHVPTYQWTSSCPAGLGSGTFSPNANVQRPTWMAPANNTGTTQTCTIEVMASDGHGNSQAASYQQQVWSGGPPAGFGKTAARTDTTTGKVSVVLSWGASPGATDYEYCWNTMSTCGGGGSNGWIPASTARIAWIDPPDSAGTYWWQVRARNGTAEPVYADAGNWWSFTPDVSPPGDFHKISPPNYATDQPTIVSRRWGTSAGAGRYEVCYDATNDDACDGDLWLNRGTYTNLGTLPLDYGRTYYWQVRARVAQGAPPTYADGGVWYQFTVIPQKFQLSVAVTGGGRITSNPTGIIDCTATGGTCAADVVIGTSVTLMAPEVPGWSLSAWGDACSGAAGCSVVMDSPKTVSATFAPKYPLSVTVTGSGTVSVLKT